MNYNSKLILVGCMFLSASSFIVGSALADNTTDQNKQAALSDLSSALGVTINTPAEAHDICNKPENFQACAEVGKKYSLYNSDQSSQVNTILDSIKSVKDELKNCSDDSCYLDVANKLAGDLSAKNPALASNLNLTPEKVNTVKQAVDTAKSTGVSIEECQNMDPDTASLDTLRACAKLAKQFVQNTSGSGGQFGQSGQRSFSGPGEPQISDQQKQVLLDKISVSGGPGGCKSETECRSYCADQSHVEECTNFAVQNGFMTQAQADQAKKFSNIVGPGGCRGKDCKTYCDSQDHQEECLKFATDNNLIDADQASQIKNGMALKRNIEQNGGPGGCKDSASCQSYCAGPSHQEECVNFAVKNGNLSQDQAAQMLDQLKKFENNADRPTPPPSNNVENAPTPPPGQNGRPDDSNLHQKGFFAPPENNVQGGKNDSEDGQNFDQGSGGQENVNRSHMMRQMPPSIQGGQRGFPNSPSDYQNFNQQDSGQNNVVPPPSNFQNLNQNQNGSDGDQGRSGIMPPVQPSSPNGQQNFQGQNFNQDGGNYSPSQGYQNVQGGYQGQGGVMPPPSGAGQFVPSGTGQFSPSSGSGQLPPPPGSTNSFVPSSQPPEGSASSPSPTSVPPPPPPSGSSPAPTNGASLYDTFSALLVRFQEK